MGVPDIVLDSELDGYEQMKDVAARRALLHARVREAAVKAGGQLLEDDALLTQVTHLVELPSPVVGRFDPRHLDLPPEVLIQEMKGHQRAAYVASYY